MIVPLKGSPLITGAFVPINKLEKLYPVSTPKKGKSTFTFGRKFSYQTIHHFARQQKYLN
jgi:hypothetical protein